MLDLGVGVGRASEVGVGELRVFVRASGRLKDHAGGIYSIPQIFDLEEPDPTVHQTLSVSCYLLKFRQM